MENLNETGTDVGGYNLPTTPAASVASEVKEPLLKPGAVVKPEGKKSLLNLILVIALLAILAWSGFLFFNNKSLKSDTEGLTVTIERLKSQAGESESKATLATKKQFLDNKKSSRILWTNVLNRVFESNPASTELNQRLVNFVAISGGKDGNLSLSVKTRSGSADPYADTAILLREFGRKAYFGGLFIPNIASILDQVGQELLSYTVNLQYLAADDPVVDLVEQVNFDSEQTIDVNELIQDENVQEEADSLRRRVVDPVETDNSDVNSENLTTPENEQ